jgi:hypothetical protein
MASDPFVTIMYTLAVMAALERAMFLGLIVESYV